MRATLAVLERDPDVREGLVRLLEGAGWRVRACRAPEELVAWASADPHPVVLWGACPARRADRAVLARLRQRVPHARLIVLAATTGVDEFMDAFSFGACACLARPVAANELMRALRCAIAQGLDRVEEDGDRIAADLRDVLPRIEAERLAVDQAIFALRAACHHD